MAGVNEIPPVELETAVKLLTDNINQITDAVSVPLIDACGHVAAEDVFAAFDNPPFNRSPLDGYALNHSDSKGARKENPVLLKVVHEIFAGGFFEGRVASGNAVRIMTGAMIPDGCDCVIRQEDTNYGEQEVEIYLELEKHRNFCFKAEDISSGQQLVRRSETLTYVHLGLLSSMGIDKVNVIRPAKVGLICTGDEIIPAGTPLSPGKIYNSNLYLLAGRLSDFGLSVMTPCSAPDDAKIVADRIEEMANEADIIITTGGVSVGKKDIMHDVFSLLNADKLFWRVALQRGTPALCGLYKSKLLICLSGNPFAAATTFELLARPALAVLTGRDSLNYNRKKAILKDSFKKSSLVRRFVRSRLVGEEVFLNNGPHSSGVLLSMLGCNSLIDIPAGSPPLRSGMTVDIIEL